MGGALLEYWKRGDESFTIVDPFLENAPEGVTLVKDRAALGDKRFDVIIVAIKPQMIDDILPDYAPVLADDGYVVSMAAGAGIARISKVMATGDEPAPVIRIMPNLPAFVGKATNGLVAGPGVTDDQRKHAHAMMERTGTVVEVDDEDQLDRVTAVAGSGPGYVFELARAYVAAAEGIGFSHEQARALVLGTLEGTIAMAIDQDDQSLEDLRNSVTSKGGTTAAGLDALNGDGAVSRKFEETLEAAYTRAVELR
ncbi:pyrroline-5-carboxylate reductase [Alteriqipengyuania lutimaris]|uniref:Pyrroline-5-carboxylate reductase n=2 Tax=Alteriqipengyuania lutimaris TaxID=1538146 RepID=A0A395LGQ5_9SPHN|nr:pyrroline-5-carboxylate reductase [Alteriqipengyuania lutimaris]RDS75759.1 pyrroline-5-carboxylate reductase [Alteriqipengyuania lutimaris]